MHNEKLTTHLNLEKENITVSQTICKQPILEATCGVLHKSGKYYFTYNCIRNTNEDSFVLQSDKSVLFSHIPYMDAVDQPSTKRRLKREVVNANPYLYFNEDFC